MLLHDAAFQLFPDRPPFPAGEILRAFLTLGFEPGPCRRKLEALIAAKELDPAWFDLDALEAGGCAAAPGLLFDAYRPERPWIWHMHSRTRKPFFLRIQTAEVAVAAEVLRRGTFGDDLDDFRSACKELLGGVLLEHLWPAAFAEPRPGWNGYWPAVAEPGIYRREHASLVLRSRQTTLITDPQGYDHSWTTHGGRFPDDLAPLAADAVVVTHSHGDHWHLPSVLRMLSTAQAPVLVPRVPSPSLLCPEVMAESVRLTGQKVHELPWWSSMEVGDFIIDVLPFYGEQPRRGGAPMGDLRNWGNCYRFTCPEFSVAILVDSGRDPMGNMVEVLERSVAQRGPIDVVLSCCFEFPEGWNPGLPQYCLTVPFAKLRRMYLQPRKRGSMTLGPAGVAAACKAARARYFLPYAHGFRGIAASPTSAEGGKQTEEQVLSSIRRRLAGTATEVLSWFPGDRASFEGERLAIAPARPASRAWSDGGRVVSGERARWSPVLDAALGARAEEIAREVAMRLARGERVGFAASAAIGQSESPELRGWQASSAPCGNADLTILFSYLDACFPDEGWDRRGAREIEHAARSVEAGRVRGVSLFAGMSGVAFAAHASSRGGTRYRRMSAALDDALLAPTLTLCAQAREANTGMPHGNFDVVSELTDVGAYLLCRTGSPDARRSLDAVLHTLVGLVLEDDPRRAGEAPRWCTPGRYLKRDLLGVEHPEGLLDYGLAPGIAAPLALLSLAKLEGVEVEELEAAIAAAASWLLAHREGDGPGARWSAVMALRGDAAPRAWRPAWCDGPPGIARTLWLAGRALGRPEICDQATAAMKAVFDLPIERCNPVSPTFCHGLAGVLAITLRFAVDTVEERFRQGAAQLARQLIDAYEPASMLGYRSLETQDRAVDDSRLLAGAAGVALVLLAASRAVEPAWDRLFLLA